MSLSVQLAVNALELLEPFKFENPRLKDLKIMGILVYLIFYKIYKYGQYSYLLDDPKGDIKMFSKPQLIDILNRFGIIDIITLGAGPFEFNLYIQERLEQEEEESEEEY